MAIWREKQLVFSIQQIPVFLSFSSYSRATITNDQNPHEETLISAVVSILREQRCKSRWNFIKSSYPSGFSPYEVSQITLHLKNNPHLALRFFDWSHKHSLCNHDLLSYSTIIHVLARSRLKSAAQTLIQTAIRVFESNGPDHSKKQPEIFETLVKTYRSCDSAPFVFDLLIKAFLRAQKIDRAVEIVQMLRSRGISPSIGTCNSLIRSVSQLQGLDAGFAIYEEIFEVENEKKVSVRVLPNVQTFNTLMLSFYKAQEKEKIIDVRNRMSKFNCELNAFTYSILMAAHCDSGEITEALRLWDEMIIEQIKPDIMAYNTLINCLCVKGEMERSEELFRELVLGGNEPTCLTYELLIKGYSKMGDVDSAIVLYRDMCRKGFKPEVSTVNDLIREMCDKNRVFEGLDFLRDVMKGAWIHPSRTTYEFLIKGLCKEGNLEEALKVQVEMVGKGFKPDLEIYSVFIEGYKKQGDIEKVRKLADEMCQLGLQHESLGSVG